MSLQKYAAFLKAAELHSISEAAEQMGYTQSAVSRMIADLEESWGVVLLFRNRGGLEITSDGLQLLPIIKQIVADQTELDYTIGELHGMHDGLIRVGTFSSISDTWLPSQLLLFQKKFPGIHFDLMHSENYLEIENWIRKGKVDCGFVKMPTTNELQTFFLQQDYLEVVLPPKHPMASCPVFPVAELKDEIFIKIKEEMDNEVSVFLNTLPYPPKTCYEAGNDHTILSMVESGLGISIMHSLLADVGRYNVVWKKTDVPHCRKIGISVALKARVPGPVRIFIAHLRKHLNVQSSCSP